LAKKNITKVKKLSVEEIITHEFIEKVRLMFQEADLDGGGVLEMNEFTIAMRKMYPNYSEKELKVLYMKVISIKISWIQLIWNIQYFLRSIQIVIIQ
jgi:hypothetical protein